MAFHARRISFSTAVSRRLRLPARAVASTSAPSSSQVPANPMPTSWPPNTGFSRTAGVCFTGSTQVARLINRTLAAKDGPIVPLIAETGGLNAMVVDSTALPEQVVDAVVQSAFRSAGQRCSALRLLCLHEATAEGVIEMLKGAMAELRLGDPADLATDVGPVIDDESHAHLSRHVERLRREAKPIAETAQKTHERAVKDLKFGEKDRLWQGKLTVYVLGDRPTEYTRYVKLVEQRSGKLDADELQSHGSKPNPYVAVTTAPPVATPMAEAGITLPFNAAQAAVAFATLVRPMGLLGGAWPNAIGAQSPATARPSGARALREQFQSNM